MIRKPLQMAKGPTGLWIDLLDDDVLLVQSLVSFLTSGICWWMADRGRRFHSNELETPQIQHERPESP